MRRILFLMLWLYCLPLAAAEVRVAVASNFLSTLRVLQPVFTGQTEHTLSISAGSTGKLYIQITHGAPFDVFLSADRKRPARLEREGGTVAGSRFTYAIGRLSLWSVVPALAGKDCLATLKSGSFRKLAIANPATAPYGAASQQTLQRLGLWEKLSGQLIRGENIGQTLQFVGSGNAELGFLALSQVIHRNSHPSSCQWDVPADYHEPLVQQAVLLKAAADNPAAQAFMEFLRSDAAATIIVQQGYGAE